MVSVGIARSILLSFGTVYRICQRLTGDVTSQLKAKPHQLSDISSVAFHAHGSKRCWRGQIMLPIFGKQIIYDPLQMEGVRQVCLIFRLYVWRVML